MAKVAVLENNVVTNIISAEPDRLTGSFRVLGANDWCDIGSRWDGAKFVAQALVPVVGQKFITIDEFRARLTNGKFNAVAALAQADQQAFQLFMDIISRTEVDLNDAKLAAGIDYFISKGALVAGDKAILLT